MTESRNGGPPTLHRTWPWECAAIRADDPRRLADLLVAAAERARAAMRGEDGGDADLAAAAWAAAREPGAGRLGAAVVAGSAEALIDKLGQAAEQVAAGADRIEADGAYYEREPRALRGRVAWLYSGADGVSPGLFRQLGLLLPGFTQALSDAARSEAEPGEVADYLFGPGGGSAPSAICRGRLAIAAARAMTEWLPRLLPPPWIAVGGPGGTDGPWLETSDTSADLFANCLPEAAAASGDWGPLLRRLRGDGAVLLVHAGPGPGPETGDDMVSLQEDPSDELGSLLRGLARLAAAGVPVDLYPLFRIRGADRAPSAPLAEGRRGKPIMFRSRSPRFDAGLVTPPAAAARRAPASIHAAAVDMDPAASRQQETVLGHLGTMEMFLEHQQRAVRRFLGSEAAAPADGAPPTPSTPMLDRIVHHEPGAHLQAVARYDVREAVFLKQHTPNVSAVSQYEPDAFGVPVMPLTFSMEALAEAAVLLTPGQVVTGFEELTAQRWMSFESGIVDAIAEAEIVEHGARTVIAGVLRAADDPAEVFLAGRVVLEHAYPPAPMREPWSVPGGRRCGWTAEDVYPKRGFHGPMLQGITGVHEHGDAGMTGELTILPRAPLFASRSGAAFQIDPVLLDSLGMGVGVWTWPEAMNGIYPVPFKVRRIRLYHPPCPEGDRLHMEIRITRRDEFMMEADLAAVRSSGDAYAEVSGWQDYVYRLPLSIHRIAADPFGQPIAAPLDWIRDAPGWDDVTVCSFPPLSPGFFDAGDGVWEKILAGFCLDPAERNRWSSMMDDPAGRRAWLMGRATVKDAVRGALSRHGVPAGAYDVSIEEGAEGRLSAGGPWEPRAPGPLSIALAQSGDVRLGAAGDEGRGSLGLAVARPPTHGAGDESAYADPAFSPADRDRLTLLSQGGDAGEWLARIWCAKQAALHALRPGPRPDPAAIEVARSDAFGQMIRFSLSGPWSAPDVEALSFAHGGAVAAICRIP